MKTGRKKRNWAGRVLLGVLLAALLSMNVYAQSDYSEGYFIYRDHGTYVSIKEYFGEESRVEIPAALGGKPVAEIEGDAFSRAATVQELVIPNTVVTIGEGALDGVERVVYETGDDPEK